ncbi:hypothetical protein Bca101_010083 [Brassica carinata]
MVGFLVTRFLYYKDWAWTTTDSEPQIGIGGLIIPLLEHMGINLGNDAAGPSFFDGNYFRQAQYFTHRTVALTDGPTRQAHEYIGNLQRWNKAQDRTIFKLKNKCNEPRNTVKRQAKASAHFMRKVADILTRGAVAGCIAENFGDILAPQPQPPHDPLALSPPLTRKQLLRTKRNPPAFSSTSGNKSPSLPSTDEDDDTEDEATASSYAP